MAQQVYNILSQAIGGEYVDTIFPTLTYIATENGALEYTDSNDAMTAANYLTTTTGITHVVVGPHPKPH